MEKMDEKKAEYYDRRASLYVQMAVLLADVAHSYLMDAESSYKKIGMYIDKDVKMKFGRCATRLKQIKSEMRDCSSHLYKLDDQERTDLGVRDSEYFYKLIPLIFDRTSDQEKQMMMVYNKVEKMKSLYPIFDQFILRRNPDEDD